VVMLAAKTLSKRMLVLAAKEDTRVGLQPLVSRMRSLEQSSSASRMIPSARRPVTPGADSLRHTSPLGAWKPASRARDLTNCRARLWHT
jgi:hypothetical protein